MTTNDAQPPSDSIEANKAAGGDCVSRLVLPLMMLDESMPETHMAAIHPETGEVWEEKQWELVELGTEWSYESDKDLRKEAGVKLQNARRGVLFAPRPYVAKSSFILGAACKDLPPLREMYHCHPKTWEKVPDDAKAKFEVRVASEYSFLGQNS
jgi:hypothetical protein